jgi:molybdate transport system substrate-binding protein
MVQARRTVLAATIAAILTAVILGAGAATPARADTGRITVFAAASLKNALDAVGARWQAETGKTAAIAYAGSAALAKQIEQGAPADLFISADTAWMDYLAERDLIKPETRRDLLGNRIVLVAPEESPVAATIEPGFDLAGLLGDGRLAIADPAAVPAGRYAKAALETLGVWAAVAGRLAPTENVRVALALVARGEAPLGIVYATDAAIEPAVRVVDTFPASTHPPIVYPVALTAASSDPDAAAFLDYLQSAAARSAFEKLGFTVLQ